MFRQKSVCKCLQQFYSQSPNTGKTLMSSKQQMYKKTVTHPYTGLQPGNKEEPRMDTHSNTDGPQRYFTKWKKPFVWRSGKGQIQGQNKSVPAKELGQEEESDCKGGAGGKFWGQWNHSSLWIVVADTQQYILVKTQRTVHHRVNFTVCKFEN